MNKIFLITFLLALGTLCYWILNTIYFNPSPNSLESANVQTVVASPLPAISTNSLPSNKLILNDHQVFQTFNNCGPAALSMALSYYGIYKSQQELGEQLRPYQNPQGDNDDKSVTLEEVAAKAEEYGLKAYVRPNGDISVLKNFISADIPVITRTYLKPNEDIGHFRIVKGYDDSSETLIQDDSFQGKNLKYSYTEFNNLWSDFNNEYLVLVPENKVPIAEKIIGANLDENKAWEKAIQSLETKLKSDPQNVTALFNLSVAKFKIKDYSGSINAFEKVENKLSSRTLWYQIEPIQSYYEIGNYSKVMQLTAQIINNHNRAFSELYVLRARVYLKQGEKQHAAEELALAKLYNKHLKLDQKLLDEIK